jgi:predicted DNA binding CopG/RHH family protein
LEQATGERARESMKSKMQYTDEPMGNIRVVKDLLPTPEELALHDETVKITISLTRRSVDYFKREAKLHHSQYQRMIRALLDEYAAHQG